MKKKGFTLVELLGVITILSLILLISVPKILDVINNSKINAFENDIKVLSELLVLEYETKASTEKITDPKFKYTFSQGGNKPTDFKGTLPSSGEMYLTTKEENGIKYAVVIINKVISSDGSYCAIKTANDKDALIMESTDSRCQ